MRAERNTPKQRYWAVVLFVLTGIGLGIWHNHQTRIGKSDIIAGTMRGMVAPPAAVMGRISHWIAAQTSWIFRGRTLATENEKLQGRVTDLETENARLREAQIKYDQLRDDLKFARTLKNPPLAAEIWSRRPDPKYDTLIISRGLRDGVKKYDLVISREGVVGYISEADPYSSTVVLLTDQNSAIGARVQRADSRAIGLCKGSNNPLLTLTELSNEADIKPGDLIVTSGLSRLYPKRLEGEPPRDLVIGVVTRVQPDPATAGKTAFVRPKVNFDRMEEVYVLQ